VGVDDSISAMTAIFLLPVSTLAPIRDVIALLAAIHPSYTE